MSIGERVEQIRRRLRQAAISAGRAPDGVELIAVVKHQPRQAILAAHDCGVRHFGDNTVQSLVALSEFLAAQGRPATWHFIGRLQRNKVNKLLGNVQVIHTVDREEVVDALARRVGSTPLDVLVQVNIGEERQKGGVPPTEAVAFACRVATQPGLRLRGLMAIPPAEVPPEPFFDAMVELRRQLTATAAGRDANDLSMGMSEDFEAAVVRGATMVRIGTGIFGERQSRKDEPS